MAAHATVAPFSRSLATTSATTCTCSTTGPYVNPKAIDGQIGTQTSTTTVSSPTGKYNVSYTTGIAPPPNYSIVVTDASTNATVYSTQGSSFEFGPKDRAFVTHYDEGNGQIRTNVTDLTASDPQTSTWTDGGTDLDNHVSFSASGAYFVYAQAPSSTITTLQIVKVGSTTSLYSSGNLFISTPPDGGGDGTSYHAVTWGFSPRDKALAYAYVPQDTGVPVLDIVNLSSPGTTHPYPINAASGYWQFSPCGDVFAIVTGNGGPDADVNLFKISDGSADGAASGPAPVSLSSTASEQVATFADSSTSNLAPNDCSGGGGGGGGGGKISASFTNPTPIHALDPVTFTDTSTDTEGTIDSWSWDFGDGTTSTDESPSHTFQSTGSYTVTLTISDGTNSATHTKTVNVQSNPPPHASFTWSPTSPQHGDQVTFTSTSTDDDLSTLQYTWYVNGSYYGSQSTAIAQACTNLNVVLTVTDAAGQSDSQSEKILLPATGPQTIHFGPGGNLQDALDHACPGDTVDLAAGTYTGSVTLDDVTLHGAGMGQSIIEPDSNDFVDPVLTIENTQNSKTETITDLTVADGPNGGIFAQRANVVDLERVEASGNHNNDGIYVQDNVNKVIVNASSLHDNDGEFGGGFGMFCCARVVMTNNEIYGNTSTDDGGGAEPFENDRVIFTGNYVHDNHALTNGGGLYLGDGFSGSPDLILNNRFVNNTADNQAGGIYAGDDALIGGDLVTGSNGGGIVSTDGDVNISNSTIVDNTGIGVDGTDARHLYLENSIIGGNTTDVPTDEVVCRLDGDMIGTLPAFSDSEFHLAPGSAAIDAGVNAHVPQALTTDADGNARIQGSAVDVGYSESPGSGTTTPTGSNRGGGCDSRLQEEKSAFGESITTVEGVGARSSDPLETTLTAIGGDASLSIDEQFHPFQAGTNITRWTDDLQTFAFGAGSPTSYEVEFDLDKTLVPPGNVAEVFFDGAAVSPCAEGSPVGSTPCISDYQTVGGDARVWVDATDLSGTWTFDLPALANEVPPTLIGNAEDGRWLDSDKGVWGGTSPITFTYQWERCEADGTGCADITGATNPSYKLTHDDVGKTIELNVTGSNSTAPDPLTVTTALTDVVSAAAPVNTRSPTISGAALDGRKLIADKGSWSGTPPFSYDYSWLRCDSSGNSCTQVADGPDKTYTLSSADIGSTIEVDVTNTDGVGSGDATSAPTGVVQPSPPQEVAPPNITGTAKGGDTLTAHAGVWTGTGTTTFSFQWVRCDPGGSNCNDIAGASSRFYELTPDDVGNTVAVRVTATNGIAPDGSDTSAVTAVVAQGDAPGNSTLPSIPGTPTDGVPITGDKGAWTGVPAGGYAYQWSSCAPDLSSCSQIANATNATYKPTHTDVGNVLELTVTATNGFGSTSRTSAPSDPVAAAPPSNTSLPTITGTAAVGQVLTGDHGSWSGTPPMSYGWLWLRCQSGTCTSTGKATHTYTVQAKDSGYTLELRITVTNGVGSAQATSADTAVVP